MRTRGWIAALALAAVANARAEVPGHNPDLDQNCPAGYQWSRETVACEQANCPPGAGRTYTLECNCGEAWSRPFVTCHDPGTGLVTHCVAVPATCDGVTSGFDPITGACRTGFVADDTGACSPTFPERLRCRVLDLAGAGLGGLTVDFGERAPAGATSKWINTRRVSTATDGAVELAIVDRSAPEVMVNVRDRVSGQSATLNILIDQQPRECVIRLYGARDAEARVKDDYADLLARACVTADEIASIRAIRFDPTNPGTPQFDPETNTIAGSAEGPWDETGRTLFHEFGHAISDQILDPTWGFVKGVPLVGKYVGGSHDNWVPSSQTDGWGPDVDPEQLAFEEGLADFLAMLHYAHRGEVYQDDLATTARAQQALDANGPATGTRTEGVITSFLWQYYRPLIESGRDGPARALGDFIRVTRYRARTARLHGAPARTIKEFIAAAAASAGEPHPCKAEAGQTAALAELAGRYGFAGAPPPTVHLGPIAPDQRDELRQALNRMGYQAAAIVADPGKLFTVPAGQARTSILRFASDFVTSGRVMRVEFSPNADAVFAVEGDGVRIERGRARVIDGPVQTPRATVKPRGTEVVVRVDADRDTVAVAGGEAEITPLAGGAAVVLIEGQAIDVRPGGGLSRPRDGAAELAAWSKSVALSPAGDGTGPGAGIRWVKHVPWIAVVVLACLGMGLALARRRSRRPL